MIDKWNLAGPPRRRPQPLEIWEVPKVVERGLNLDDSEVPALNLVAGP